MEYYSATYSPEDNKLRLHSLSRLDAETYARVKAAGFSWTPGREDLLIELCGEIGDENQTLSDRASERAERFEDYSERRAEDADRARGTVSAIADNIPFGQPILVGHHSERRARKDAERIENGMRKTVRLWECSKYWQRRAAAALHHAEYKERPDVRFRRIKGIEADSRKKDREFLEAQQTAGDWWNVLRVFGDGRIEEGEKLAAAVAGRVWCDSEPLRKGEINGEDFACGQILRHEVTMTWANRWKAHFQNRLEFERAMLGEQGGIVAERFAFQLGGKVLARGEWATILRINTKDGQVCSVSTNARFVRVRTVEEIQDYQPPAEGAAAKVKAATKLSPLCNYPGAGFHEMTKAEYDGKHSDFKRTKRIKANETHAAHRVRHAFHAGEFSIVYLTDAKRKDAPELATEPTTPAPVDPPARELGTGLRSTASADPKAAEFEKMKSTLREGVKVVSAPQLFPTPAALATRVVELARLEDGHRLLEPSAGTGALLQAAIATGKQCETHAVEINANLSRNLAERFPGCAIFTQADFLTLNGSLGTFDRIVMNPPFGNAADIAHILHAKTKLKPGGRLVAICANGPRQQSQLRPLADEWHDLPPGSFQSAGTMVQSALIVITQTAGEAITADADGQT